MKRCAWCLGPCANGAACSKRGCRDLEALTTGATIRRRHPRMSKQQIAAALMERSLAGMTRRSARAVGSSAGIDALGACEEDGHREPLAA